MCSGDKEALLEASGFHGRHSFHGRGPKPSALEALPAHQRELVESQVVSYTVPAMTPEEVVLHVGARDAKYVQIDVEGFDNDIVQSF